MYLRVYVCACWDARLCSSVRVTAAVSQIRRVNAMMMTSCARHDVVRALVLDAFDSPDLTSDQVLSKSGRSHHHPPAQKLPHRSFPFSTYDAGLFRDQLEPQFMIEESDFDESSCQSTDDSSASLGAKRRRGPFDFKSYINNCELSPLSSSSSSPDAIDANANSRVSWVRTRGKFSCASALRMHT